MTGGRSWPRSRIPVRQTLRIAQPTAGPPDQEYFEQLLRAAIVPPLSEVVIYAHGTLIRLGRERR